jgi:hypothetical protein
MKYRLFLTALAVLVFISCEKDSIQSPDAALYPDVDARLWQYFASFEREAAYRNLDFDLAALGITGVIDNIEEDGVAGTCQYGQHIAHVTVDQYYWNNVGTATKEYLVFHELGHCVLGRGHTEDAFANGICKSIMSSGLGTCHDAYNVSNRNYYIDELFSLSN